MTLGRTKRLLLRLSALALLAGPVAPAGAAPKTDVVIMRNRDRITCEVHELERGKLRVKTDDLGTIEIEWDKVDTLRAGATFEIEDVAGTHYYGSLRDGPRAAALTIESPAGLRSLDMLAVVRISRLGTNFWKRLDGSIDLTTNYASASEIFTFDFGANVEYERPGYQVSLDVTSTLTRQPDVTDTRRWNSTLGILGRRPNHWFLFGTGLLEQNRELGYDLRGALAGGLGRYLFQHSRDDLLAAAGVSVNREVPVEGDSKTNTEFLVNAQYDRFSYDFPKVDIFLGMTFFQGLTETDRFRIEGDARLKREIVKDFNVTLRAYESYDSRPPTEGAAQNDYGWTFGFGWSF